jgi:hypothetical protein
MHRVIARLDARRQRELRANVFFAALDEVRQRELLDFVAEARAQLARNDALDKLREHRPREIAAMKVALATIRELLARDDFTDDIFFHLANDSESDHVDSGMVKRLMSDAEAMGAFMERFPLADDGCQQRTRLPRWEAYNLFDLLTVVFGMTVSMRTPDGCSNPGLELIGLLADPPVSAEAIRYRLRSLHC